MKQVLPHSRPVSRRFVVRGQPKNGKRYVRPERNEYATLGWQTSRIGCGNRLVITSYSIHYTKLYELLRRKGGITKYNHEKLYDPCHFSVGRLFVFGTVRWCIFTWHCSHAAPAGNSHHARQLINLFLKHGSFNSNTPAERSCFAARTHGLD